MNIFDLVRYEECEKLKSIIKQSDLNAIDSEGLTLLQVSCLARSAECTEFLLSIGANPNLIGPGGITACHFAALSTSDDANVQIDALARSGANLEARLQGDLIYGRLRDWTPIMLAAAEGGAPAVSALANQGARVNSTDWSGMTPLMLATCQNVDSNQKINILLNSGADYLIRSNEGKTALDYSRDHFSLISSSKADLESPSPEQGSLSSKYPDLLNPGFTGHIQKLIQEKHQIIETLERLPLNSKGH